MARQEQMQNDTMNFDPFFNPNNAANGAQTIELKAQDKYMGKGTGIK